MNEVIHIFDCHEGKRGSKCFTIEINMNDIIVYDCKKIIIELKTNERLPNNGIVFIPNRNNDNENKEFEFKLQGVSIPNYNFGVTETSMNSDVKAEWESLSKKQLLQCDNLTIECHKEMIDTSKYSILGIFNVYVPRFIIIKL